MLAQEVLHCECGVCVCIHVHVCGLCVFNMIYSGSLKATLRYSLKVLPNWVLGATHLAPSPSYKKAVMFIAADLYRKAIKWVWLGGVVKCHASACFYLVGGGGGGGGGKGNTDIAHLHVSMRK